MSTESSPQPSRRGVKVAETVAREIVRDAAGQAVGTTLPSEATMMKRYAVSRGSLREALRLLEVQGLIMIKPGPGGGPVLLGANPESLGKMQSLHFHLMRARYSDLTDARMVLEPQIARMAAERPDREVLDVLLPFLNEQAPIDSDPEYVTNAQPFHSVVASLSGNPVLDVLVSSLQRITLARMRGAIFPVDERRTILSDHAQIARAILAGNGPKAELLMRDHMSHYRGGVNEAHRKVIDEIVDWY